MADLKETSDLANFDPYWYAQCYEADMMEDDLDSLHEIFNEIQSDIRGKRLLDIGTGPAIYTVISASNYVDEIFLSDYAPQNREYLTKWWKGEISYPKDIIDYIIEEEDRHMTTKQREDEVRERVKGIYHIDILSEQPLGFDINDSKFDVIVSGHCLDGLATNLAEFKRCLQNVSCLLHNGGFFIMSCGVGSTYYQVGEYKFVWKSFTKDEVKQSVLDAGFSILSYIEISDIGDKYWDAESHYYIVARKQ
ncbi:nicotinamide N-methyltransferase-like [Argopecten irradians]|uniref:nicotinamide N-methyltransferase-like n=1 Tax=Argopecten irradians TaxID=31199 RepID=UPI00371F31BD